MPEDKFSQLYSYLKENQLTDLDQNSFKSKYSDINKAKELHTYLKGEGMTDLDLNSFHNSYFGSVKKKDQASVSSSQSSAGKPSSGIKPTVQQPSSASSSDVKVYKGFGGTVYEGDAGIGKKKYVLKKVDGVDSWYEYSSSYMDEKKGKSIDKFEKKIIDPTRIKTISNKFGVKVFEPDATAAAALTNQNVIAKKAEKINSNITKLDEDDAVAQLKNQLKEMGTSHLFEVEATGAGYDAMRVRNKKTGEYRDISLDNWTNERNQTEASILKNFIKAGSFSKGELEDKKKRLQEISNTDEWKADDYYNVGNILKEKKNLEKEVKSLEAAKSSYIQSDKKVASGAYSEAKKQTHETTQKMALHSANILTDEAKEYSARVKEIQEALNDGRISNEDYNEKYKEELDSWQLRLQGRAKEIESVSTQARRDLKDMDNAFIEYSKDKATQGNFLTSNSAAFMNGIIAPTKMFLSLSGEKTSDIDITDAIPGVITKEYTTSEDRSTFEKAINGVVESLGAAISTGGVGGAAPTIGKASLSDVGLFALSYNSFRGQMDGEEFNDVPEYEKILMSTVYGAVIGKLEKFGLDDMLGKTSIGKDLTGYIMKNTMARYVSKEVKEKSIDEALEYTIKQAFKDGVLNVAGSGAVEAFTEGVQGTFEVGLKSAYNSLKGDDFFKTPKNAYEFWSDISEQALTGFVGGSTMRSVSETFKVSSYNSKNEFQASLDLVQDKELSDLVKNNVKQRLIAGEIKKDEARDILNGIKDFESTISTIPDGMSADQKFESYNLLQEKAKIQKEIAGKDESLVAVQKDRIKEIDESLVEISKRPAVETKDVTDTNVGETVVEEGTTETVKPTEIVTQSTVVDKPTIATNSTTELNRVKSLDIKAEDGATFNLDGTKYEGKGLVIPVASKNTTAEEITPEMLADFVEEHQDKIGEGDTVKFGIYKFPSSNEVSIDLNIVAPETSRAQAIEFGKLADQESLFDLSTFENIKTGGTGKNPMSFTAEQFKEISKAFSEGRMPNVFGDQVQQKETISKTEQDTSIEQEVSEIENLLGLTEEKAKEKIAKLPKKWHKSISRATRAMKKVAPNVRFVVHETSESFNEANPDVDRNQINKGLYIPASGKTPATIHINLENADTSTIAHEVFHAILIERVKTDKNAAAVTKNMVEAIKGKVDPDLQEYLDKFISNYDENIQNEEYLAELVGDLSESYEMFGESVKGIIKRWLDALAKIFGLDPFNRNEVLDTLNTIARKTAKGKVISESDINMMSISGVTTEITPPVKPRKQVKVGDSQKLTFVKKEDLINIDELINEISDKKQKVWFWVADQLGRGNYYDSVLNGEHFLDAGPSFALDPKNRSKNIIWASGANLKKLNNNIDKSDYIFIISGSPQKSKLFNKTVANLVRRRIESVSDFDTFKKELLEANPTKNIKSILEKYNTFDELFSGSDRKTFIIAINEQKTKNTPAKRVLDKYNAIVDENNLRDGFYESNGFDMGDIILVLKADKVGGKSEHSTYENDILGDVIGVPDKIVNAYDIMPKEIKDKYRDDLSRSEQSQAVAPYGIGIKEVSPRSQKQQLPTTVANKLTDDGKGNYVFHHYSFTKRDEIKPGTGQNSITSKDEASALSAVNGIAQYYTAGNQKEAGVGPNLHTVLIDKNAVYDFNSDPENFYEEAERRFNEVRPGQAFNANYQLAFITQVANENGYDMVVARWRDNELRAQTTKTLAPNETNVDMKPVEKEGFNIGDEVFVFGDKAVITDIKGDIVSYKGESSSGSINIDRNPKGIRYQKGASIERLIRKIKAAGFSDAGLTAALKKQGFSDSEISNALNDFNAKKDTAIGKANEAFDKAQANGKNKSESLKSALDFIKKFVVDDMEREHVINEFLKSNGERLTVSPSSKKISNVKDVMRLVNERVELKRQILKENRDRKAGIKFFRGLQNEIIEDIRGLEIIGKLKGAQLKSVLNRLAKTNMLSESAREKFFNYVENVINNSNYAQEISDLNRLRASIKKKAKSKTLQNSVAVMAKNFTNVDPFLVEDLEAYKDIIEKVKNAVKSSVLKGADSSIKTATDISEVNEYANNEIKRQDEIRKQQLLEENQDLVDQGLINDKMDLDLIRAIVKDANSKPETESTLEESRQFVLARFDSLADIINEMLNSGEFDGVDSSLISRLLGLDLNNVKTRDILQLVEAMDNMIVNEITDGVEAQIRAIEGANKANKLADKGVSVKPLKALFNKKLGTAYNQLFTSLPLILEKAFASKTKALAIMREMGFNELVNGVASANFESTKVLDGYLNKFRKTKPNGERFDSAKNNIERGFIAFLTRNVNGTDLEKATEFARRVKMINDTVAKLENGTDKEIRKAAVYKEVMDSLDMNGDARTAEEIVANANAINVEAVDYWKKEWADRYDKLSDISSSVYNSVLGSDIEYTPDSYRTIEGGKNDITDAMISQNGGFASNFNYTDTNRAGVLMASNRPNSLPLDRYVDLDFDSVNNRAMTAAIIDMNTAAAIRQVKGFQDSDGFKKIFEKSPENRELVKKAINNYILEAKNKKFSDDNIAVVDKILNTITQWGAAKALGGITQVGKQVIPVMINTVINAGATNFISAIQDSNNYVFGRSADFQNFLERAGVPILSRGLESVANIEAIDKRLNDKLGGTGRDILDGIDTVTNFYLKNFLAKPDVWIARSSFLAYYKQSLKRQGVNGEFDLSNEINEEAAAYAQQMVDRQQNVSDAKLMGEFFRGGNTYKRVIGKILMPFANFVMNQKNRMYSDVRQLTSKESNTQDKYDAIRSLAGMATEMAAFHVMAILIKEGIIALSDAYDGEDDDEEKGKKDKKTRKVQVASSFITDILSPLPIFNDSVISLVNGVLGMTGVADVSDKEINEAVKKEDELRVSENKDPMTDKEKKKFTEAFKKENDFRLTEAYEGEYTKYGMYGIAPERLSKNKAMAVTAMTGEYEIEYNGNVTKKQLTKEKQDEVKNLYVMTMLYDMGLLPTEVNQYVNQRMKMIKKSGMTEEQHEKYNEVKDALGEDFAKKNIDLIKSAKKAEMIISQEQDRISYENYQKSK